MLATPRLSHAYIHVPFCARRCSYCDFAIAVRSTTPVDEYLTALSCELAHHATDRWNLTTLYFGGGTPSRLGAEGIAQAIQLIRDRTTLSKTIELTIEANPDDVTPATANAWAAAGVNRISLGVQSFDESVLRWMHRTHTADQAKQAITILRDAGILNISVDLIFALPPQIHRDWHRDLDQALSLDPDHISLYGLTVEAHTPLARWRERGVITDAPEDQYEADFLYAHHTLASADFAHYEVSNYARPNRESRHNSSYWSNVSYAGLGPSAHGFTGITRSWNVAPYAKWVEMLERNVRPIEGSETLTPENRNAERVYLGLRTRAGLNATEAELAVARDWISQGWADIYERTIVLTPSGWLRLDALATVLTGIESR